MVRNCLKTECKVLLFAFFMVFLSCFYTSFKLSTFTHQCDDPSHCALCLDHQVLNCEPDSPLGSNLNVKETSFVASFLVHRDLYSDANLVRSTPVSERVKKTE